MKIASIFGSIAHWAGWGSPIGDVSGLQRREPTGPVVSGVQPIPPDHGLQLSAVWSCVTLLAETIASLPIVVYRRDPDGNRTEERGCRVWQVLRAPNANMTPHDFWMAMGLNRFLRGNGYALISRDGTGQLVSLTPLAADQMDVGVVDGEVVYQYYKDGSIYYFKSDKILHWKGLGNGIVGLSTLEYMQATTTELVNAQKNATTMYGNGNQLTGLLMIDQDLNPSQIRQLKERYANLTPVTGSSGDWLHVLPGDMKYQQISMSAADAQLLETRQFGIEEIGRWFGVPSALLNSSGGTAASGLEQIIEGFYRSTIQPLCTGLEQALTKTLLTIEEQETLNCEFKMSALQRANIASRYDSYSKALQNGFMTRNEVRKLENLPTVDGADALTAQNNLVPLDRLGEQTNTDQTPLGDPIKQ
ncbi:MAG: phage portal protein [Sutterella sp.]|nr:phage portal protein [Sutterella sp.]DAK90227.1 MAG TPA: portal protein [Caudoviricetes sp.]DAL41111.1 MAG TPA_asm: portal protein [Caudoviricetes sp.]